MRPTDAQFIRLSTEQGLSQDDVYTILQDHQRFLWFGTGEGLSRYDGYSFKTFKSIRGDASSLPSSWVHRLYEDRLNRLWVGTVEGLSLFDRMTETFRTFRPPAQPSTGLGPFSVSAVLEDRRGRFWVGTSGSGLYRFDPATGAFGASYLHSDDPASLSDDDISRVVEDHEGRIWVGTAHGLNRLDPDNGAFRRYIHSDDPSSLSHDWVWDLAEDRQGRLWVATFGGGLSVLDPERRRFERYGKANHALPDDWTTSVFVDRSGTVWAGTDNSGLLRFDPKGHFVAFEARARDSSSLSKNIIRSIAEDLQGNLWVGTFKGGVNMLPRRLSGFSVYTHDPFMPDSLGDGSAVNAMAEDQTGAIWVAISQGGLDRFDRKTGTFVHHRNDPANPHSLGNDTVTALLEDREGRLWVGTHGSGLNRLDAKTGTFERLQHGGANSLGNDYVWAIAEDESGALWIGTDDGLDRFDVRTRQFTHFAHDPADESSLGQRNVRALIPESSGDLWIGTLGGLDFLPHGSTKFTHYRMRDKDPHSLSNNAIAALHEDAHHRLFVGTLGGGLDLFAPGTRTFTAFRVEDGLPSDSVFAITEDGRGRLWIGTNNGLARFNPDTHEVKSFGRANGLRSVQFGLGACARTRDGRLLFGSADSLYLFDPQAVQEDAYVPPVAFTALRLFGQPANLGLSITQAPEIQLTHAQNVVSLEFAALDFTVPRANSYLYQLEGFRPQWTALGPKHEVTFTNLDPGTYTLRVRASNSDGVWNETGAAVRIVVTPPFWATWWFRVLLVAALAGALTAAYRTRVRSLELRERELTRRVEEALGSVKILRGLLPMCSWCKKVRDDGGYWNQIEAYLAEHSEADFSHGICPDCARRMSPHT